MIEVWIKNYWISGYKIYFFNKFENEKLHRIVHTPGMGPFKLFIWQE